MSKLPTELCAPCWLIIWNTLFYERSYFNTGNMKILGVEIRFFCLFFFFFAVPFFFSSASKCSHGTPHWVPAHAGRIMDGDLNTYEAEFSAAAQM